MTRTRFKCACFFYIFAINREDTAARSEITKQDFASRSLICIFAVNRKDALAVPYTPREL